MTATASTPPHIRVLRLTRRALDRVEQTLRPDAGERHHEETETTREILLPSATGESRSRRAQRQAHPYLARRRRQLARRLDGDGSAG